MKIKKICFVGYGSHVKKTLIPSLTLRNENIKIISSKSLSNKFVTFPNIVSALNNISKDYIIYNATPPNLHYRTSKLILSLGFNIIVEKPLCLNITQLKKLRNLANSKKLFIFENMMYFQSKQFSFFKKFIKKREKIKTIELSFTIPNFNKKSFRSNSDVNCLLYDVGCYPFSLISFLNYKIKKFAIDYKFKNKILNYVKVNFQSNNVNFRITIGYFLKYSNFVKIIFNNQSSVQFDKFFYGKKIRKQNIINKLGQKKKIIFIKDYNVFRKIFNYDKNKLRNSSKKNIYVVEDYLRVLGRINTLIIR
jgi:predicted dehydrogenase